MKKSDSGIANDLNPENIPLTRLGDDRPAGLWITSLPWPRMAARTYGLNGMPAYCRPLGQWPDAVDGCPRRLLMVADGGDHCAPDQLRLTATGDAAGHTPPTVVDESFGRSPDPHFMWERHRLRIDYQGRSLALAMGLRTGGQWHWWEACRLIVREETPTCRVVEMGGAIPLIHSEKSDSGKTYQNDWLHKHHWLYGHITVRCHANGVCEVFARHVNSKYVDEGGDLAPAVPVIGLWTSDMPRPAESPLCGVWDGSCESFELGKVSFDVAEVARLATPEQPGRMDGVDDMLVWQPYRGCALYGGLCAMQRCGEDGNILLPEEEKILRGMSRTLRFSCSLSDRSPRIARYLAPDWWYGLCEEFLPAPLLPVYSGSEAHIESAREWIRVAGNERGFEDGGMARGGKRREPGQRLEPGWEGEIPYAQFLSAWRYTDAVEYDMAMRSAYHFSDIVIDHAANLVRMHGFPPIAFAIPMNRVQGPLAAFLETGDDFLFDAAEKVVEAANRQHRNAWPRFAVGRDACFVRGAVLLYRYFANPHFLRIARNGALAVAQSQRANGSFGDQGGGTGVHQWSGYVTKPWMGLLATNGVLDYLELFPNEPELVDCVRRFADWLMAERTERAGAMSWGYQHDYNGGRTHQQNRDGALSDMPSSEPWHQDTLARLLGYCALRFNRSDYLDAWAGSSVAKSDRSGDHGVSATLQFLPWIQAQLWRTTIGTDGELCVRATHFGAQTFPEARIHTPTGTITLAWDSQKHIAPAPNVKIQTQLLAGPEAGK